MGEELAVLHEVAAGGAAVFVAEMARDSWEAFRSAIARFMRTGAQSGADEERAEEELRAIEAARATLLGAPEAQREEVARRLEGQLMLQLAMFLRDRPAAVTALRELLVSAQDAEPGVVQHNRVHDNTSSQIIISGGPLHTSGIAFGAPGELP
ncbi:hypothetical protein [Streptomyces albidoflavus]|uniref:hypothetical protein n=1 Tax=Streptomyces albidoflavus TaxID=1886 RepID=UPI0004C8604B|nr:hypothetical protein [Streptomyces albidoflavus]